MEKPDDAVALLRQLTADDLRARLDQIDAERRAVAVLYRSARARERGRSKAAGGLSESAAGREKARA
jgi:hypothetical protein